MAGNSTSGELANLFVTVFSFSSDFFFFFWLQLFCTTYVVIQKEINKEKNHLNEKNEIGS